MVRFEHRVFGPGPLRRSRSRVLLAIPGVDYSEAEAAEIRRRAGLDAVSAPAEPAAVDDGPQPDEDGLINRGNGWFELPNGRRIRGREKAVAALAEISGLTGDDDEDDDGTLGGDQEPDEMGLRPLGGDWWQLPDGERVHGRDAAEAQLAAADGES